MAKKRKDSEPIEFRFDDNAGETVSDEEAIDLFADDSDPEPERPITVVSADEPSDGDPEKASDPAEEMARMFDRYASVSPERKKKNRYGKRKNVPQAEPHIVMNETIASRELQAAKERSEARKAQREAREKHQRAVQKRERKTARIRFFKTIGLVVGAVAVLAFAAWISTRVTEIKVSTVEGYTAEELVNKSGLVYGRCILFQNLTKAKENLESDPYLQADVRYTFPSTVTLSISRRTAAACVRWGPQSEYLAIIDPTGIVLNADADSVGGLIVADGLSITTATAGRMLGETTDLQVMGLVKILSKIMELNLTQKSPRISTIDMSELMNISMRTDGANYSIQVGDTSNLDTKFILLQRHWDEIMSSAAQYIANGSSTATIYLYSKGGVAISPYAPGYSAALEYVLNYTLPTDDPNATAQPETTPDPYAPAVPYTPAPEETTPPGPTPMPHQGGAFTG